MESIINPNLEEGTYQIICSKCRLIHYGPTKGTLTDASKKSMEIENIGEHCANNCNCEFVLEIHPKHDQNKFSKENPYK